MDSFKDKLNDVKDELNSDNLTAADDGRAEDSPPQPSREEFVESAEGGPDIADQQSGVATGKAARLDSHS